MEYTKGKWKLDETETSIFVADRLVANCGGYQLSQHEPVTVAENKANAQLIAAAVNACASVNPDNPMAVADSIKPMYEVLKSLSFGDILPEYRRAIVKVLAEVEGK